MKKILELLNQWEVEYRAWRSKQENVFEPDFEDLTIHNFIKWLRFKESVAPKKSKINPK